MFTQNTPYGLMRERQAVLRESYLSNPELAMVTDYACTDSKTIEANHALHNTVSIDKHNMVDIVGGVHTAVGGDSDAPTPGDLLCGAIAACFDSTIRIIANGLGLGLSMVRVEVTGRVDVRGTLMIDTAVPVGFQEFIVNIELNGSTEVPENQKRMLIRAAERSCIVMQTLQSNSEVAFIVQLKS